MGFYDQISKYYDYIFPVGITQLEFIKNTVGRPPKKILDVACGSGGYAVSLAKEGYQLVAADIDDSMVKMAKEKAAKENVKIEIIPCDMRYLKSKINKAFDSVYCIGNSIVHLNSIEDIMKALGQMRDVLLPEGNLILQIINYDRILKYGIDELPEIENKEIGLKFIRKYQYNKDTGMIQFITTLMVEEENNIIKYDNSIELIPLLNEDLVRLLKQTGFSDIRSFGDFNNAPHSHDAYMTVIRAAK